MLSLPMVLATLWNLFLAALPIAFAHALVKACRADRSRFARVKVAAWGAAWMALLPNSPYLLTEWRHFLFNPHFQAVRDATNPNGISVFRVVKQFGFFAAYSGFGLACFASAIRPVADLIRPRVRRMGVVAVPFFFLVSLGVYLGLIVRLNSWDLVTRRSYVLIVAGRAVLSPTLLPIVVAFAVFLFALFVGFDIWMDGLALRRRGLRVVPRST